MTLRWMMENTTIRRLLVEPGGQLLERRTKTGAKGHRTSAVDPETTLAADALRERRRDHPSARTRDDRPNREEPLRTAGSRDSPWMPRRLASSSVVTVCFVISTSW
jgi:hypothetical protein